MAIEISTNSPGSTRPWIRSGTILAIIEFLEREGYDARAVVGDNAMRMAEASDAYRQVDLIYIWGLFQRVVDTTGVRDWGLRLGMEAELTELGPWGYLFLNAPTVGDALWDFVRFGPCFQTQTHFGLQRGVNRSSVEYSANRTDIPGWEIDAEISVTYIAGIVNSICRRKVIPDEVQFDHAPMCSEEEYLECLGVRPRFGYRINRLFYKNEVLEELVQDADPKLYRVLSRHLGDMAAETPAVDSLASIVANNVRRGMGGDTVSLEHVAAELGMESRTLQRRLDDAGTTFQQIVDRVRLEMARYYLERTSFEVTEIAMELGYSHASAFSRAFKRWTGMAPAVYRSRH